MGPKSKKQLTVEHVKGSGPGGQNRNKRMSGVRVTHEPTGIVVRSTHRRSQKQNLLQAFETLEAKIEEHFFVPKARRKTKPTRGAKIKRVESKKHRSTIKKHRNKASWD